MTDAEWADLQKRCAQYSAKPGETIGILAALP